MLVPISDWNRKMRIGVPIRDWNQQKFGKSMLISTQTEIFLMYYTYIARCSDGSLYTGYCRDLKEREEKHNLGLGARYTKTRRPLEFVYFEEFLNRSDAMKREAEIKKWKKTEKESLILSGHSSKPIEYIQ